jgi:pimeloyl-ACP methyl ester carboxylesterase
MKRQTVTVNGIRTSYEHAGSGPTLFMLHGQLPGSCVATEWGDNVQRFADAGFEVYAPDLAGFGQTDNPSDYSFKARIAHAKAFIDHFEPKRYSLWGSSIGTYKGCAIALEDSRVDKLIIMPSTVLPPPLPEGTQSVVPLRESVADMVRKNPPSLELAHRVLSRVMSNRQKITDRLVKDFYDNWKGKGEDAEREREKIGKAPPLWQELHRLKNPSLLLWGADEGLPERSLRLQRCIPGSELHVLQGSAHWPQIDQPERTFRIVSDFLHA